ncbi:hypothetical protein PG984_016395 [Apiospora sp. TS-2023a]
MLDLAGKLFATGYDVNLGKFNQTSDFDPNSDALSDLPRYEWKRSTRYIHQARIVAQKQLEGEAPQPLPGSKSSYNNSNEVASASVWAFEVSSWSNTTHGLTVHCRGLVEKDSGGGIPRSVMEIDDMALKTIVQVGSVSFLPPDAEQFGRGSG